MSRAAATSRERFYDTIAESFDDVMNEYDVARRLDVVFSDFLADCDLRDCRVLDAGCGTGRFSERAAGLGAKVVALDIGPALLMRTRQKCDAAPACADIARLPFRDDSFDVVISSECIEHTVSPRLAVRELVRVTRPGGRLVITCPNRFWFWSCAVANYLKLRPYEGLENWPGWLQLRSWIRASGAKTLRSTGIHLFPFVIRRTEKLLRFLDRAGPALSPVYLNQAVLCTK